MLPEGKCRYIDGQIYPDGNFYVLDTQHIKHNGSELKSALNGINTDISNKVDKVAGKGLSTEDYTTAEKNKLSGIEANANNYIHPTTSGNKHIPGGGSSGKILGWSADGTAAWVDPASGGGGSVDTVSVNGTTYSPDANGKVTLPNYPTVIELGETSSTAYRGDRGKNAYNHAKDSNRLTTAKASGLYKVASTAQGHIASLTAVVKSDITGLGIPAQDTTYSAATQSADGLMSSSDKTKLNGIANGANKIGYELKSVSLNSLSWTQTAVGIFYSSKVSIPNLSKIFGMTIYGFANLRYTDVITPKIYGDNNFNGISFLANTGSFHNGATLDLLVFGIST